MGFNNGYDSGYSDCEAENRKKWEKEAVAKYIAEHGSGGGASRAPKVFIPSETAYLTDDGLVKASVLVPETVDDPTGTGFAFTNSFARANITSTAVTLTETEAQAHVTFEEPAGGWVVGDILACICEFNGEILSGLAVNGASLSKTGPYVFAVIYDGTSFQPMFWA